MNDDGPMPIEPCDVCGAELEPSQIGTCENCQRSIDGAEHDAERKTENA